MRIGMRLTREPRLENAFERRGRNPSPRVRGAIVLSLLVLAVVSEKSAAQINDAVAAKFKQATEAQRAGRLDEAAAAYAEVIKMRPNIAEAYVNLGLVRHEQKRFEDAVSVFEKAIALKPSLSAAHLFLGIDYYSLNRLEAALKEFEEAARQMPNDPRAVMWLGLACMSAGKTADAARHLDRAAALAPTDVDILYHRGRAHLRLSQESYREMFKLDPKSARVHQVLAQSYEEAGRDAEAIAEYELTVKLAPNMPGAHDALGSLYWKNSKLDEAEAAFEQELRIDPHSTLALYKLGSIRVERGKTEQGLPMLEAALRLNPDLLDAYYYLGKGQASQGKHELAIASFKKLTESNSSGELTVSAYYQLAQVYRKQGRQAEARAALEAYQKLKDEREQQRAEKLEELKRRTPN